MGLGEGRREPHGQREAEIMSIYHSLEMTTQIISLEVGLAGGREGPGSDECLDGFSDKGPRGRWWEEVRGTDESEKGGMWGRGRIGGRRERRGGKESKEVGKTETLVWSVKRKWRKGEERKGRNGRC